MNSTSVCEQLDELEATLAPLAANTMKLDITGRSSMSKFDLIVAIKSA